MKRRDRRRSDRPVRYAVLGAGHIAQNAVLPAFDNARRNSELTAIFSGRARKRSALKRRYRLEHAYDYADFERASADGLFDAVYIALPNSLHREFTERAAAAGVHVLCEKPMATTVEDCRAMIRATRGARVKLMIAYRLHFERANMKAAATARSGRLGALRLFNSVFCMQVKPGNIRLDPRLGGGPLYDIGIYCINAARYLFGDEPTAVLSAAVRGDDRRFRGVHEAVSAVLEFPDAKLACFTCSFGADDAGYSHVVGTRGQLCLDPAYEYAEGLTLWTSIDGKAREQTYPRRDQFAPELIYFSDCIINDRQPEPGGEDGLIDVAVIEAVHEAARTGRRVDLPRLPRDRTPDLRQVITRPPARRRELVGAAPPHPE